MTPLEKAIEEIRAKIPVTPSNMNVIEVVLRSHIKEHPRCGSCGHWRKGCLNNRYRSCLRGVSCIEYGYEATPRASFYCPKHTSLTEEDTGGEE